MIIRTPVLLVVALATAVPAQNQEGAREKIREILQVVAGELTEIDTSLQESARTTSASSDTKKTVRHREKLIVSAAESQKRVIEGIDALLQATAELTKLDVEVARGC